MPTEMVTTSGGTKSFTFRAQRNLAFSSSHSTFSPCEPMPLPMKPLPSSSKSPTPSQAVTPEGNPPFKFKFDLTRPPAPASSTAVTTSRTTTTPDMNRSPNLKLEELVPKGPTRDPAYYRETGDCVILVGNVLFRLHKFLLIKDSVEFQKKFDGAPEGTQKGLTDTDAIILYDDVTAFRHLCWVLYANLHELSQVVDTPLLGDSPVSRTQKLSSIASITHKYKMTGIRDWAIQAIAHICMKTQHLKEPPKGLPTQYSLEVLKYFTIAAEVSQDSDMLKRAQETWTSRIENGESIVKEALDLAEERRWREFQGRIYLAVLRRLAKQHLFYFNTDSKAVVTVPPPTSSSQIFNIVSGPASRNELFGPSTIVTSLSAEHRTRLFEGHWVLTKIQRELYSLPKAHIPCSGPLSTMNKLEKAIWEELWEGCMKIIVRQQQVGSIHDDPLAMLTKMRELIKGVGSQASSLKKDGDVRQLGKLAEHAALIGPELFKLMDDLFELLLKKLLESLPDYFSVP